MRPRSSASELNVTDGILAANVCSSFVHPHAPSRLAPPQLPRPGGEWHVQPWRRQGMAGMALRSSMSESGSSAPSDSQGAGRNGAGAGAGAGGTEVLTRSRSSRFLTYQENRGKGAKELKRNWNGKYIAPTMLMHPHWWAPGLC
jgi:hypothetical protein